MALDNPSYFSIAGNTATLPSTSRSHRQNRRGIKMGTILSSASSSTFESSSPESSIISSSPSSTVSTRRGLRTFLRSVSANSTESNQESFILGEPRPCDIAPPSPFLPRCSFGSDFEERRSRSSKKSHKTSSERLQEDLLYSPLPTSDTETDKNSEEEVFLEPESVRYYNLQTSRRHSIGTCFNRDRKASLASTSRSLKEAPVKEDYPEAIIHATADGKPVVVSSSASSRVQGKSCNQCTPKKGSKSNKRTFGGLTGMDDILIISSGTSEAAGIWINYLNDCFVTVSQQWKSKTPLKVFHITLEDIVSENGLDNFTEERILGVKLQIMIVCPTLLHLVEDNATIVGSALSRLLHPDRVLAMLLGMNEADVTNTHKMSLVAYDKWKRMTVRDGDGEFVAELINTAVNIIGKIARQQSHLAQQEKKKFSVVPKKIKTSQRRVVVLLNDELQKTDKIVVTIDKQGEMLEVEALKRRNAYTLQFYVPASCLEVSVVINVIVEKNGTILGSQPVKCESKLQELDQILRTVNNPMEFMCQTLGFSPANTEQLDTWLVQWFQRNIPPHFNLLVSPSDFRNENHYRCHPEEFPTLLHFAARFGLMKLALQILECPGGEQACDMLNACGRNPADIAENAGHTKLAQSLRGYAQMNEFTNMYQMLKGMTEKNTDAAACSAEYLFPKSIDESYCVPPAARPFVPPNVEDSTGGYMTMQPKRTPTPTPTPPPKLINTTPSSPITENIDRFLEVKKEQESVKPEIQKPQFRNLNIEDRIQSDLAEIITDFKNNVISMHEVENLVEQWKNRNDVQQSFKDKQESLLKMRDEYERLQHLMKDEMKKTTPFEKFKSFFSWSKSKGVRTDAETAAQQEKMLPDSFPMSNRPISSMSIQSTSSTSSSARMSTVSGCSSIGDSGTHSDDDRRHTLMNSESDTMSNRSTVNYNYMIPPAPKPVFPMHASQLPPWQFNPDSSMDRPPVPLPRPDNNHYIHFPPSGLPVNIGNFTPSKLDEIKETEITGNEYMEFNTTQPQNQTCGTYMNITDELSRKLSLRNQEQIDYMNISIPEQSEPPPLLPKRSM